MDSSDKAHIPGERAVIGLLFAVPVALFVWPALPHFFSAILGVAEDSALNLWTFWHTTNAVLLRDEPLYSTMRVLAPIGSTLALHDTCVLPTALLSPLTRVVGAFAGFNLLLVFAQVWAGVGMFILVRYLTGSKLSAAFAAYLIESSPILYYRMLNHYSLAFIGFIPVFIYFALRAANIGDKIPARRLGLICGSVAVACFFTSMNLFMLSFITVGAIWTALVFTNFVSRSPAAAMRMINVAGWAGIVCTAFLFLWAIVSPVQDTRFWWLHEPIVRLGNEHGAHPAYFFVPNPRFWLFADYVRFPAIPRHDVNPESFVYLGAVNVALLAMGFVAMMKHRRTVAIILLVAALVCMNLSLGYGSLNPLASNDAPEHASPWLLFPKLLNVPLMKQARVPARWAFPLVVLVIAFAGCGMNWLLGRVGRPVWRVGVLGAVCILVLIETAHKPAPALSFEMPKAYEAIGTAQDAADMIIEWPISVLCGMKGPITDDLDPQRMVWSTRHGYRIVNGYLMRVPVERMRAIFNQPRIVI